MRPQPKTDCGRFHFSSAGPDSARHKHQFIVSEFSWQCPVGTLPVTRVSMANITPKCARSVPRFFQTFIVSERSSHGTVDGCRVSRRHSL